MLCCWCNGTRILSFVCYSRLLQLCGTLFFIDSPKIPLNSRGDNHVLCTSWYFFPLLHSYCAFLPNGPALPSHEILSGWCVFNGMRWYSVWKVTFASIHSRAGGFPGVSVVKNPPGTAGDARESGSIPGSGRCPGVGNGNPTPVFLPGMKSCTLYCYVVTPIREEKAFPPPCVFHH